MLFDTKRLGARIKECRDFAGLTQKQLGELAGLAESSISAIETGIRRPSAAAVYALAQALKICTDYLYGNCDQPISFNQDNLIVLPRNSSPELKAHVNNALDMGIKAKL